MSLETYRKKRNFKKTSEPRGRLAKKNHSLVFVIQKHAASHLHYDFRLELDRVLKSWAVPKGPCLDPHVKRLAVEVEDHPLEYGNFEGVIPKGQYGGGAVLLWDKGEWLSKDDDPRDAYAKGNMTFQLKGKKLKGLWKLIKLKKGDNNWLLFKKEDKYAKPLAEYDITLEKPKSVVSRRSIEKITGSKSEKIKKKPFPRIEFNLPKSAMPKLITPELATLVDEPPFNGEWLHEIKWDGYRLIAIKKNGKTTLYTRNHNNWTHKFKNIAVAMDALPIKNIIVDGEVVMMDENKHSNFQLLQNSIEENQDSPFVFCIFDLIYLNHYDLSSLALIERKKILFQILSAYDSLTLHYSDHIVGSGNEVLKNSCRLALEGIVSKNIDSLYVQKRTKDWLKAKCLKRQEFLVGGYTLPKGQRKLFGSLLLGTYKNGRLIYHGKVGTGFNEKSLHEVYSQLKKIRSEEMPFETIPTDVRNSLWVIPKIVIEVEFTEWTDENYVRHPSFKGLRVDKKSKDIVQEKEKKIKTLTAGKKPTPKKNNLKTFHLSHPEKILYPEKKISKLQVAEYYDDYHQWILPYIKNRPLSLVRCPDNYRKCFFQKHIDDLMPGLYGIDIREKGGNTDQYFYIKDRKGLLSLAQISALEMHPWGSTIKNVEKPDMIIFDIDPGPDVLWKKVIECAFELKKLLQNLKLTSFVKTTGGKGLHVVVPIKPRYEWDEIKSFTHAIVNILVNQNPKLYTAKMNKNLRTNKIFVDYLRNQRGATAVAPYSLRARENATIAVPLSWNELTTKIKNSNFTLKTIAKRLDHLKKDPWQDFFKTKQSLPKLK